MNRSGRNIWKMVALIGIALFLCVLAGLSFFSGTRFEIIQTMHRIVPVVPSLSSSARILFVGDMQFDRYIRTMNNRHGDGYVLSCVAPLLAGADFVVGNLEGPITAEHSVSEGTVIGTHDNFVFTFPTTTAMLLKTHHMSAVNIGNNHIDNQGQSGIVSTKKFLTNAGVSYFGGLSGDEPILRTQIQNVPISFVSYNQFGGQSLEKVAGEIAAEHVENRVVIVYAHWGDEYSTSTASIRSIAELFAENGADAIIGSHPHIVLPREYIGRTLVYYSLGNFIFDQYWNRDVRSGLTVELSITASGGVISAREIPVYLERDGRTCPVNF